MAAINKYKTKILIDRTVGVFLCYCISIPTRLLGAILKRDHSYHAGNVKTIVIAKYLGLGSILQSTPLLRALKIKYPNARIIYVSSYRNEDVLKRISLIDDHILVRDDKFVELAKSSLTALFKLWKFKVDLYFDLEVYSSYASVMNTLSLARNRYGFYRKSTNFRKGLHTSLMFFNTNQHIVYNFVQLGGLVEAYTEDFELMLPTTKPEDRLNAEKLIESRGTEFIAVNVNASDLLLERRWPATYYADLLDWLAEKYNFSIFLIGSKGERDYVQSILDLTKSKSNKIINIAGQTNLGTLIFFLGKAKFVVTNDTGPLHLSFANKIPTLSLWGPGSIFHYGPMNKEINKTLFVNIFCSPCLNHADTPPCNGDNQCMKLITVARVSAEIDFFMQHKHWNTDIAPKKLYLNSEEGKVFGHML